MKNIFSLWQFSIPSHFSQTHRNKEYDVTYHCFLWMEEQFCSGCRARLGLWTQLLTWCLNS